MWYAKLQVSTPVILECSGTANIGKTEKSEIAKILLVNHMFVVLYALQNTARNSAAVCVVFVAGLEVALF
jgi:hypothetical protein